MHDVSRSRCLPEADWNIGVICQKDSEKLKVARQVVFVYMKKILKNSWR